MAEIYSSLLEWRRGETTVRSLSKLPADYYTISTRYLEELKRSYEAELREDPSARKGEIARQTYQRASQVARDILESRLQKLLTLAFQASIGAARDLPNSLPEERAVFDRMLSVLLEYRQRSAPYLEPQAPAGSKPAALAAAPAPPTIAPRASPSPASPPAPTNPPFVRIVGEGRKIEVGKETIDLATDDVVSLPPEVAKLLVDAKVAEPVRTASLKR